jgi:hypothetical protein
MTTSVTDEEIWKRRREQDHPPTPVNPYLYTKDKNNEED